MIEFCFESTLETTGCEQNWYFISLPKEYADDTKRLTVGMRKSFGSVRVEANIGEIRWKTSIFPDGGNGSYIMFLKKEVRQKLGLQAGDSVTAKLEIIDSAA